MFNKKAFKVKSWSKYEHQKQSILDTVDEVTNNPEVKAQIFQAKLSENRSGDIILRRIRKNKLDYFLEGFVLASKDYTLALDTIQKENIRVKDFYNDQINDKSQCIDALIAAAKQLQAKNKKDSELYRMCKTFGGIFAEDLREFTKEDCANGITEKT